MKSKYYCAWISKVPFLYHQLTIASITLVLLGGSAWKH